MAGQDQADYDQAGLDRGAHDQAGIDQLEIIGPDGQITFYDLDADRGITNIGRDPNNDLIVDSPGVGDFHAVIDHRRQPYQIMLLGAEGSTRLRGLPLPANSFQELHDWDTIEIDGHSIVLFRTTEGPAAPARGGPSLLGSGSAAEGLGLAPLPAGVSPTLLPRDQRDELILTEISAREWTVDVEQTAACTLTIVNGGNIVASFAVDVEGVPREWVTIAPPRVNLNEGARATVAITITPPRLPTSQAGVHPLVIAVTSPNYRGHASRNAGTLLINPYYAFTVGELSPKQQTVSWRKPTGQVTLPITNDGNSETPFRVDGEDEERKCRFEFAVPGQAAHYVRQAEVRLKPEQTLLLPIDVTPFHRRFIGLRKRHFSFTVTTTMLEAAMGGVMPRSLMGRLSAKPLIGPLTVLLFLLSLAALIVVLGRPQKTPILAIDDPTLDYGQEATLTYDASRFLDLSERSVLNRVNGLFVQLTLEFRPLDGEWRTLKAPSELTDVAGTVIDVPLVDGDYRLRADNWISSLIASLSGESLDIAVDVEPIEPRIVVFRRSNDEEVYEGQEVVLTWTVNNAETLRLTSDDPETLVDEDLEGKDLEAGRRTVVVNQTTTYALEAANSTGAKPVQKLVQVVALPPPVPTPVIVRFDVEPQEIMLGEAVQLGWAVTGADVVEIKPVGEVPLEGEMGHEPKERTSYQLIASKLGPDGTPYKNQSQLKDVIVNPLPTATLEPEAPVIDLFEAIPKEVVAGDAEVVEITWSVLGITTSIEIASGDNVITGLAARDVLTVTVNETTLFVLTAANGELKTSKAIEIKAIEPTPTPVPTPVPTEPPPTPTPFPAPIISYLTAAPKTPDDDRVVYKGSEEIGGVPYYKYEVEAGSYVKVSWGVKNADVVILGDLGPQPAEGEIDLPNPVTKGVDLTLVAENSGEIPSSAVLRFVITAPDPPPPPSYVTGDEDPQANTNTIYWTYSADDQDQIDGFRVYRAEVPPGTNFVVISDLLSRALREFSDETAEPTCGLGYYVVAVYTDPVTGVQLETAASLTSWYSRSCPLIR